MSHELVISLAQPLTMLQAVWFSTEQRVNAISQGSLLLSTAGNALQQLSQCDADIGLCQPGKPISVSIKENGKLKPIFVGFIVGQALKSQHGKAELTLTLKHSIAILESTCRSQIFLNTSASNIIAKFFKDQNIQSKDSSNMNVRHEQQVQFRCSDWLYIRSLLDANGAWLLPNSDKVKIIRPKLKALAEHTLQQKESTPSPIDGSKVSIIEADWQFNDQYQPKELQVTAWDISQQKLIAVVANSETLGAKALNPSGQRPLNTTPWVIGSSVSMVQKELTDLAQSTLQYLRGAGVQGQFKVTGSANYELGQTVELSGFGKYFDGKGIITAISHDVNKTEWTTVITLGGMTGTLTPVPSIRGLEIGVIAKFEGDPNKLDRMRVSLPALGKDNNVLWARLAMPYASKNRGFSFYPEPGDEVVLGFFEDLPCFPIILGSMYNPKNTAPVALTKDNNVKGITLKREGEDLCLQFDTKSNSTLIVADKDLVELKEGITINSKSSASKVEIQGKKINLKNS